jgi:hypothetical protein
MMLYNIHTAWNDIRYRANDEIVFIVSSLHRLRRDSVPFLFTDRHAYLQAAEPTSNLRRLSDINWRILQNKDFRIDPENPAKREQYQAEALVHRHLPVESFLGIVTCNDTERDRIDRMICAVGITLRADSRPGWYFR